MVESSSALAEASHSHGASPNISIIIPVRDDAERLEHCLESLLADARPDDRIEIIVGDNGSKDHCARVAESANAVLVTIEGISVAAVRNAAAKHAHGTLLAFIDSDHTVSRGWISAASRTFCDPRVGAAGSPCWAPYPGTWVQQAYDCLRSHPPNMDEVEWIGSGNLVVRHDLFTALGGFDSTLEACEDVDLCLRIRNAGYLIVVNPAMKSTHWGDPQTLSALFRGELWRGRNNLKVSFRKPFNLRSVASAAISLAILVSVLASICTMAIAPLLWNWWVLLAIIPLSASIVLRFSRMMIASRQRNVGVFFANMAVAGVYEAARALAILLRVGHCRRFPPNVPQ